MESAPLLGRTDEMAAIERFLDGAADDPRTLVISGPAGIGKTAIWSETGARARERTDGPVLTARASESEIAMAYVTLTDLLDSVVASALPGLPEPQRAALAAAMLRAPAPSTPDPRTIATAVLGILRTMGPRVILAIDDAQWVDRASIDALAFALRRLHGEVRTIVSVRTADATTPSSDAGALPSALRAIGGITELLLGPISLGVLHHLVADRVGTTLTRPQLVRLEAASGGNALLAIEMARELARRDRWPLPGEPMPFPADTGALLRERLARMSDEDRELLFVVAAMASPTVDDLRSAMGAPFTAGVASLADVDAGLARAGSDGLVSIDPDGRVRFAHPLIASAALDSILPERRRAIHAGLARAAASDEERGRHIALAVDGPSAAAAVALDTAAAAARGRGATSMAADWAERAAAITPPDDLLARGERRIRAGRWSAEAGELDRGRALLTTAIADLPAGDIRARARLTLAPIVGWDEGAAVDVATSQAALEEANDPRLRARLWLRIAFHQDFVGVAGALEATDRAVDALSTDPSVEEDPDLLACALLQRASLSLSAGIAIDAAGVDRAISLLAPEPRADADGDVRDESLRAHAIVGDHLVDLDRLVAGRVLHIAHLERDIARGLDRSVPIGACETALIELWLGDWTAADAYAEQSMAAALQAGGSAQNRSAALSARAHVDAYRGDLDAAERAAREGTALAEGANDWNLSRHEAVLGHVALSRGDAVTATAILGALFDRTLSHGDREMLGQRFVGDLLDAASAAGDVDRVEDVTASLETSVRTVPRPWVRTMAAKGRALYSAAAGDLDAADAEIGAALAAAEDLPMPYEVARLHLVAGRIARRRKERRRAADHLAEASSTFRALGAMRWVEITEAEQARTGRRTATTTNGLEPLTETEDRVARLAARGLTNREVGDAAFLTPKSVEGVLARVYGKLGIRSRAELGAWLASQHDADPPGPAD